jgi:hypothetical protein
MSTINSFPMPKGTSLSIIVGGGTKFWVGECRSVGSHESSCRMAVARLQMGSENTPHSFGQGDLLNVRCRYRRIRSLAGSWVQHWIAVAAERLHRWKADLKSILLAMICLLGYFLLAGMVQLMSLHRQVLYTHGMSNSLMVLLLTNIPDSLHLKLWSWVSFSLSIIFPVSLMLFWCWIFIGTKSRFGMSLAFCRGRGMQYPCLMSFSTSSCKRTGLLVAPLWFPNLMASSTSAIRRSSARCSKGQCNPSVSILFILGQIGWCQKIGSMIEIFLNPDPIPRGELLLALSARCRLPQCFSMRMI